MDELDPFRKHPFVYFLCQVYGIYGLLENYKRYLNVTVQEKTIFVHTSNFTTFRGS